MLYIDVKYANMLSTHLQRFKKKSEYLWNYRCNICGDSSKDEYKARAYIYRRKNDLFVRCHNCNYGTTLGNFIKITSQNLYKEYVVEKYLKKDVYIETEPTIEPKESLKDSVLDNLICVANLPLKHPVKQYVISRKIPEQHHSYIYYTMKFMEYTNSLLPNKFMNLDKDHPRLVIPYFNEHGLVYGFSGRAFKDEQPKYFSIKLNDNYQMIYGLDRVDFSKRIYAFEGEIDSLFIDNSIAVSGSSFDSSYMRGLQSSLTIIHDNEPRSVQINRIIKKNIELGYAVFLWPDTVKEKDLNDCILAGYSIIELKKMIDNNTYIGMEALIHFTRWKKR